jgi:predicted transcriptional regulator
VSQGKEAREIPAVDFRRTTRTGKVKAVGGERDSGWFGVDKTVYKIQGLTKSAKKVYVYLSRIADQKGYCYPFYKTIAKRCNISTSTVAKALNELEEKGLITRVVHRYSRRGVSSNIYRVKKILKKE